MSPTAAETTADLMRRLKHRYDNQSHVVLCNVGNGAGFGNSGWSDAIAMSIWPSKGLRLFGFEVKATRSDWLRELDKPDKNAEWQANCHEWYVVAPKGVVEIEELPTSWGLMVPRGKDGLRIASRCEREIDTDSVSLDLLAAVFRAAESERADGRRADRISIRNELEENHEEDMKRLKQARSSAEKKYEGLCSALGESFYTDIEKIAAKAKLVAAIDVKAARRDAENLKRRLEVAAERIDKAMEGIGDE